MLFDDLMRGAGDRAYATTPVLYSTQSHFNYAPKLGHRPFATIFTDKIWAELNIHILTAFATSKGDIWGI